MTFIFNDMFHTAILTDEQKRLLKFIQQFRKDYYLVGGTAIALQMGHRRSIDFDLFTPKNVQRKKIRKLFEDKFPSVNFIYEDVGELHLNIGEVKITFFQFNHAIQTPIDFNGYIAMPALPELAAMKAYAFAERAKWKDYVDMYFLLKNNFSISQISQRADELFNTKDRQVFSEKLFRLQLSFFSDINYSEPIEYMNAPVSEEEVKKYLTEAATSAF